MPRVAVIVPNYNHARYLEQRLRSIQQQTFQDFELLLLDDASSDGSVDILESFAARDEQVRLMVNASNSGSPFHQWRRGIEHTTAPLIWIAEADDDADPGLLAALVACFDTVPGLALAYCQSHIIDEKGDVGGTMLRWTDDLDASRWLSSFINDGRDECARFLCVKNTVPNASAVVFSRAAYAAAGGVTSNMRLTGDWLLWIRLLLQGPIAYHASPLNRFRQHGGTVRSTISRQHAVAETLAVHEYLSDALPTRQSAWRRSRELRQTWWQAVHAGATKPSWPWIVRQVSRARRLSSAVALWMLVMSAAARVLDSGAGLLLLNWKRRLLPPPS